ncbi:FimV/HubP family polar landmark protein [uncultured Oxalicibacterium sp.]|uniref:FimV/HubP family polar landmark protein n=1 Tax=uncultured Oxalicibacterium sp. TaxID=1168540 RepID=UPI0025CD057A|nr:FimV/HubP family polar landmark protein [uncultured Oxalicibacterium sp.]
MSFKMRSKSRSLASSSPLSSFRLKAVSAAVLSLAVLASAHAAGLGRLSVQSALGQPLRAEIELTAVAADELESLQPRLASADAYRQANIELTPALLSLRFSVERRASGPVVRVTSTQPINEPFVDMLMELGGNRGRLVREYTFLLDPPELRNGRTASVAPIINSQVQQSTVTTPAPSAPAPVAPVSETPRSEPRAVATPTATPATTPRAAPRPTQPARPAKTVQEHTVKKGDTLANIANQYREPGVSLDQMLVALYRANPDAFVGKNMNRLRAGQILSIPAATEAETINAGEARGVVVAQTADFNAYRNKLASQVGGAQARRTEEGRQSSSGSITARVQEEGSAATAQDRLRLSKSGNNDASAGATAGASTRSGVSEEDLIARDKAIAEANARVRELEKNVSELQKLLEIKNQDLAARQQQAEAGGTAAAPATSASNASAPVEAEKTAEAAVTPPTVEKPAEEKTAADAAKPAAKPPVVAPVQPAATAPETSFFDDLSNNPLFLPGAGILLALLAALGIYSSRRRKQPVKTFEDSILSDSSLKSNSLFGATGGQSVDTNNSVFNSNFVPSASQLDTNEVDPIAEADVYIAYGRDAQAEEILKEALRNQPDRHAVRLKLLEIYSMRGDARAFEVLATELYSMTRGEGPEWEQAATLGAALDPDNPLYASAATTTDGNSKFASVLTAATVLAATEKDEEEPLAFTAAESDEVPTLHKDEEELSFSEPSLLGDVAQIDEPAAPVKVASPLIDEPQASMADLEFDLDGFDDQPKASDDDADALSPTQLASADLPPEVAAINFDFLDKGEPSAPVSTQEDQPLAVSTPVIEPELSEEQPPVPPPAAAPEVLLPEAFDLEFPSDLPPAVESPAPAVTAKPEDFDLSDISLELDPLSSSSGNTLPPLEGLDDEASYSGSAEMATKLDLALAYQEIGDKEGARELLEEVVKGGNGEQSARATALLAKLN